MSSSYQFFMGFLFAIRNLRLGSGRRSGQTAQDRERSDLRSQAWLWLRFRRGRSEPMAAALERVGRQGHPQAAFVAAKSLPVDLDAQLPQLSEGLEQGGEAG